jgi:hypothetical protein
MSFVEELRCYEVKSSAFALPRMRSPVPVPYSAAVPSQASKQSRLSHSSVLPSTPVG